MVLSSICPFSHPCNIMYLHFHNQVGYLQGYPLIYFQKKPWIGSDGWK